MSTKRFPIAMFAPVPVGGTALMFIQNPTVDPSLCYSLIYSQQVDKKVAMQASAVVQSFDYLLSRDCTMKEAVRRLRVLRAARKEMLKDRAS